MIKITVKFSGEDEEKFNVMLKESGLNKSEFVRQCIFNTNIISQSDRNKDKQIYQELLKLKNCLDVLKVEYKNIDFEEVETELLNICHII